jgi:hypothetical protein
MNTEINWDVAIGEFDLSDEADESPDSPSASDDQLDEQRVWRPAKTPKSQQPIYLDLETIPDESREHLFGFGPLPQIRQETGESDMMPASEFITQGLEDIRKSLSHLNPIDTWLGQLSEAEQSSGKKPRKGLTDAIAALKKERLSVENAGRDRIKKMSITPEMCQIAAIGWAIGGGEIESKVVGVGGQTEVGILEHFWAFVRDSGPVVGFNICGFDLPVIFVRSMLLGVPASRIIDLSPYRNDVVDLMISRFGRGKATRLKLLAQMYGINVPAGDTDGSHVAELMATNPGLVGEYVRSDVHVTRELHRMYSGMFCV